MFNTELIVWNQLSGDQQNKVLSRPHISGELVGEVSKIIQSVIVSGDQAIAEYAMQFDQVEGSLSAKGSPPAKGFNMSLLDPDLARSKLDGEFLKAFDLACNNIDQFHRKQLRDPHYFLDLCNKQIRCERLITPLESVGLYVPAATYPLFSSLMMMVIPAKIAGVKKIVVCSPPNKQGTVHETIRLVASILEVDELHAIGGAQAVAAMGCGTQTVSKVDKIFGPGNRWVTQAKKLISDYVSGVSIDMPAGASEVMVVADESANLDFVSCDLLAQAEHGSDSQMICILVGKNTLIDSLEDIKNRFVQLLLIINDQASRLKTHKIVYKALKNMRIIYARDSFQTLEIINLYAPEHLILQVSNPRKTYLENITNAGSVFIGHYTPESLGDYGSGTNHVLPTHGFSRSIGGLGVESFQKSITFQQYYPDANDHSLARAVVKLANYEGLDAHSQAMQLRIDYIESISENAK